MSDRRDAAPAIALVAILACTVLAQSFLWWAHPGPVASSVDTDLPRYAAQSQSWSDVFTVSGFGPFGYPLVLHVARGFGADVLVAARAVSLLGALVCLVLVFAFVRSVAGRTWAALAVLALAANGYLQESALLTGAASPAGAVTLSVAWLVARWSRSPGAARAAAVGAALGALALLRADALLPVFVFALGVALVTRARGRWWMPVCALAVFAPQMGLSMAQHGTPLHSTQAKNVWFGMHGNMQWQESWNDVPDTITLREVIAEDPALFLRHWSGETVNGVRRLAWMLAGLVPIFLAKVAPVPAVAGAFAATAAGVLGLALLVRSARRRSQEAPPPTAADEADGRRFDPDPRLARHLLVLAAIVLAVWVSSVSAVFSVHRVLVPAWLLLHCALFAWLGRRCVPVLSARVSGAIAVAIAVALLPSAALHLATLLRYAELHR